MTEKKSKEKTENDDSSSTDSAEDIAEGEEEILVKEPHFGSAREEAVDAAIEELRDQVRATIAAHDAQ